jgi:hypothetical protein
MDQRIARRRPKSASVGIPPIWQAHLPTRYASPFGEIPTNRQNR